jgi:sugar transferase (PEP-CTERM/EpsH1 system associated)
MLSVSPDIRHIRIVHVLHSFDIGGLENGVVNLINCLDWQRYSHVVCCLTRAGRLVTRLKRQDVQIVELKKTEGHSWWLPIHLARLFKRIGSHIVHTRNWGTIDGIIGARLSRIPIVVHGEHGRTMVEVDGHNPKRTMVRRGLSPLVDRFITVSEELEQWLSNSVGVDRKKITRICNGVDLAEFLTGQRRDEARAKYHLGQDEFLIGTVGRLDPIKGHVSLMRAFAQLATKYPLAKLLVVGAGPCYQQLESLKKQLRLNDRIVLLGERDDVSTLLQSLDVYVLPSIFEGISNTILEAMASGLPVVATRVGGNGELIQDGVTGQLIPKQDVAALTEALALYLRQPSLALQHGAAGRRRVEEQFSLPTMVAAYDRLYSGLVRERAQQSHSVS